MTEDLVLASASTIRAELLASAGVVFRIESAELDESFLKRICRAEGRDATGCALALAEAKARDVAAAVVELSSSAPTSFWCAARCGSTSPRISNRPAPNFRLCAAGPTSLSRQSARFRTDRDYGMPRAARD